jgi:hypothetical protein
VTTKSSDFDAYFVFLGIPPKHQPPTYYRLLDVQDFEEDLDTIDRGYERRMAYLHMIKSGDHLDAAEDLKAELARARICLLSANKRKVYDDILRERLTAQNVVSTKASAEASSDQAEAGDESGENFSTQEEATAENVPVDSGGSISCNRCGVENRFADVDRGQQIHCGSCGSSINVPAD